MTPASAVTIGDIAPAVTVFLLLVGLAATCAALWQLERRRRRELAIEAERRGHVLLTLREDLVECQRQREQADRAVVAYRSSFESLYRDLQARQQERDLAQQELQRHHDLFHFYAGVWQREDGDEQIVIVAPPAPPASPLLTAPTDGKRH